MTPDEKSRIRDAVTYLVMLTNIGDIPGHAINASVKELARLGRLEITFQDDDGFPIPRVYLHDTITGVIMTPEDIWRRWNV